MGKKKYTFDIGNNRLLTIAKKYDQLCIEEKGSVKSATFTPSRWASFLLCLDEINSQVEKLVAGENIAYRCHYGGGWCVSVTSGFTCVDLRQFYQPFGKVEWKPTRYTSCSTSYVCSAVSVRTIFLVLCQSLNKRICYVRTGIALRLSEWETFRKVVIDDVRRNHPVVANFTPCFLNEDHTTMEGMQTCRECNPYTSSLSPTNNI